MSGDKPGTPFFPGEWNPASPPAPSVLDEGVTRRAQVWTDRLAALPSGTWVRIDHAVPGGAEVVVLSDRIAAELDRLIAEERG